MRSIICIITLFLLSLVDGYTQTNRALLVAIDSYPEPGGWAKIHACNDLELLLPVLEKQGFRAEDRFVLRNEQATRKAIDEAFIRLSEVTQPGDFLYIHFSCHGQQMADNDGDEPDGLDEALIPYDARRRFKTGVYEGENHLRDDQLYVYLETLRKKVGKEGDVVVVLDACHSGTGTRDAETEEGCEYARGTSYLFAPPGFKRAEEETDELFLSHQADKEAADILVVAACQSDEINYEFRSPDSVYYGRLSYAVSRVMDQTSFRTTHRTFTHQLREEVKQSFAGRKVRQTPYIESTHEGKVLHIGR